MTRTLAVWLGEHPVASLTDRDGRMEMTYGPDARAISLSLPVRDEPYGDAETRPILRRAPAKGSVRDHLARQLDVSPGNDFSLLAAVGGDFAGAVRIVAEGVDAPADDRHEVRWLSEAISAP